MPDGEIKNFVKEIYEPFTAVEISDKIAELLTPPEVRAKVSIVYQDIEDLHKSCPKPSRGLVLHRKLSNRRRKQSREQELYFLR